MPSKKKKYNARFPAGRIKKIMQSDEEIGKVAQAVPVIISRTLELFVESLLTKTLKITNSRNAKTLSTSHMKQCIMSEQRFDFLRELVKNIPDINVAEEAANYNDDDGQSSPEDQYPDSDTPYDLSMPSTSARASISRSTSVASNGYAYTRSKSVNGNNSCSSNLHNLKRDYDVVQRLQQHIENRCTPSSVIMHTTAVAKLNCEQMPAKLQRSESTPTARSNTMSSRTATVAKSRQIDTAIPAPIVSYELNKPIVKIDYSNINIPQTDAPLSAPAHINAAAGEHASSAFNFATAPVINIDLSNISVGENTANITPAIATISIGALPPNATASPLLPSTPTTATKLTPNSKAKMAAPLISAVHSHTSGVIIPPKPTATTAKNSFFELDEDYDNI